MVFGSPEKEVKDPSSVEIKINTTALFLFILSLIFIFIGAVISPIVIGIGVIGAVVTMVYAAKNWFKLEEIRA
ncbi:hypothetical protein [Oceanobacillus locisalsi]|uniref:Uncharacterized protein n=1 Tax=Oceanobacillus locisalsi TaxID=546107 RepID=A0ABW3NM62_9BACI